MLRALFLVLLVGCSVVLAESETFKDQYNEEEKKVDTSKSLDKRIDELPKESYANPFAKAKEDLLSNPVTQGLSKKYLKEGNSSNDANQTDPTTAELLEANEKSGENANPWDGVNSKLMSNPFMEMIFGKKSDNTTKGVSSSGEAGIVLIIILTVLLLTIIGAIFWRVIGKFKTDYNRLQAKHDLLIDEHGVLAQQFEAMFANIVHRVERKTNEMIRNRNTLIQEAPQECLSHCKEVKQSDQVLLDALGELTEYFKIQAKLIELTTESIDLNTLLGNLTQFVQKHHQDRTVEITYEVNLDVPQFFLGDFKRINNILLSAIDYAAGYSRNSIRLVVSRYGLTPETTFLEFKFITSTPPLDKAQKEKILMPFNYQYSQKGLFLSQAIAQVMDGVFDITSNENGNVVFLDIPLVVDEENQKEYHISRQIKHREELDLKHVAIIDKNSTSAKALEKSFLHFTPNVQVLTPESISIEKIQDFYLVMVEHSMIDNKLINIFDTLQERQPLRVVAMHSSFKREYAQRKDEAIDYYVNRPLSPLDTLLIFMDKYNFKKRVDLYDDEDEERFEFIQRKRGEGELMLKQYVNPLPETQNTTKESLVDFIHTAILLVDDDLMYKKIFHHMIKESAIRTAIASSKTQVFQQLKKYYNNFGCIVINIGVDHNAGYDICNTIRQDKGYDKIPIFAMVDSVYDKKLLMQSGVNGYILKPMRASYFYTALSLFLDKINPSQPLMKFLKSEKNLDITQGIMYSNHKEKSYIKLLNEFSDIYANSASKFEQMVHKKEYKRLKEFILTMKNSASVIGAHILYNTIIEIEDLILNQQYDSLTQYIESYHEVMEDLNINIEIYMRSLENVSN